MPASGNEKNMNQSVNRVIQLLEYLSASKAPMRLQDIAAGIHMPQATALRYLNALAADGYVFQDMVSERYALTWKICRIGSQVRTKLNLRLISNDIVSDLSRSLDFGICLVVEQDMECMYLDCIYEPESMGFSLVRIGKQTPLHAAGSGKVFLSEYTESELDRFIREKGLPALTENTITSKEALLQELYKIREAGYALDDEECEKGLRCVAVPVYSYQGKPAAAISAFGSVERISDSCIEATLLPALREAAEKLSFRLGKDISQKGKS